MATVTLVEAKSSGVNGTLSLMKTKSDGQPAVMITGTIFGLEIGQHGFHVHEGFSTGNDCEEAKEIFNTPVILFLLSIYEFDNKQY